MKVKSHQITHWNRYSMNTILKIIALIFVVGLFVYIASRPRVVLIENVISADGEGKQIVFNPDRELGKEYNNFNLLGDDKWTLLKRFFHSEECTIDYINTNKLQQDHPCVIEVIKKNFLHAPPSPESPYHLDSDSFDDRSPGQTGVIHRLLKNQTKGFFIECGALDGEFMSNTIDLERKYGWTGILIEANPITFEKLKKKNRKSWILPVCLSLEPYPTKVKFQPKARDPGHSHIEGSVKTLQKPGINGVDPDVVEVQCFPLYSILLAVGQTNIDFFSLDVEGHEISVLKTIPFHKVSIKTLTVEWDNIPEGEPALTQFMEKSGFLKIGKFSFKWSNDVIFIKDLINAPV